MFGRKPPAGMLSVAVCVVTVLLFGSLVHAQTAAPDARVVKCDPVSVPVGTDVLDFHPSGGIAAVLLGGAEGGSTGSFAFLSDFTSDTPSIEVYKGQGTNGLVDVAAVAHPDGPRFVVADATGAIALIDPSSGEAVWIVEISEPLASLCVSQDGAHLFYAVEREHQPSQEMTVFGAIDARTGKDRGFFSIEPGSQSHQLTSAGRETYHLQGVSSDGQYVYFGRKDVSPSGVRVLRVDTKYMTCRVTTSRHESAKQFLLPPYGAIYGRTLWSGSLEDKIAELPVDPQTFIEGTPFVVGFNNVQPGSVEMNVVSLNTHGSVAVVKLTVEAATDGRSSRGRGRRAPDDGWFFDAVSGSLLGEHFGELIRVDVRDLELPDEPLLVFEPPADRTLTIGEPWSCTVEPIEAGASLQLLDATEGLRLRDNELSWEPSIEDVGVHEIRVALSGGNARSVVTFSVIVVPDLVRLPFEPTLSEMSEDRRVLALSKSFSTGHSRSGTEQRDRVALIDLERRSLLLDKQVEFRVGAMTLAGDQVILGDRDADAMHVLSPGNDDRILFTSGRPNQMKVVADRLFVQALNDVITYTLPTFDPVERADEPSQAFRHPHRRFRSLPSKYEKGWLIEDVVRSPDLSTVHLIDSIGLPQVQGLDATDPKIGPRSSTPEFVRWGVSIRPGSVIRTTGQTVATNIEALDGVLLDRHPAALFLRSRFEHQNQRPTQHIEIVVVDLKKGRSNIIKIYSGTQISNDNTHWRLSSRLMETDDGVAALVGDHLFLFTDAHLLLDTLQSPLHFEARQPQLVVDLSRTHRIEYTALGGEAPIAYGLGRALQGLDIDRESGVIVIDPEGLDVETQLQHLIQRAMQSERQSIQTRIQQGEDVTAPEPPDWRTLLENEYMELRRVLDIEVSGCPLPLRLTVTARDRNQQQAASTHAIILDIPFERLNAEYSRQMSSVIQQARQRHQQETERQAQRERQSDLVEENEQLRKEVERLRAQIEVLKQLLENKNRDDGGD